MKVIYVFPEHTSNAGDFVILEGTKSLLNEALGEHDIIFFDPDNDINNNIDDNVDLIVVCGTPWIWDCCEKSAKYSRLQQLINKFPNVKKIALGLGSCFPLTTNCFSRYFLDKLETQKVLREIYSKFSLIITRDRLAELSLLSLGLNIKTHRLPCPAAFSDLSSYESLSEYPLLVYYNPKYGISESVIDLAFQKDFMNFQHRFINDYKPKVLACSSSDLTSCAMDDISVVCVKNAQEIFEITRKASFVVSGRIHAAIPAFMMKKEVYILPVDTRFLTATEIGIPVTFTWGYKSKFKRQNDYDFINVDSSRLEIVKLIKEALC